MSDGTQQPADDGSRKDSPPSLGATQPWRPRGVPVIPGVTLGAEIARGGMGVVYHGVQDYLERRVAVKVLCCELQDAHFNARFRREAKILAGIQHPNIVSCYSAGITDEGLCFMVMEYVDGPTLLRQVQDHGPLPGGVALLLCHDLARALRRAHEAGIIHRDVKAENVLLEPDERRGRLESFPYRPKLVDLGLARTDEITDGLTAPGAVMGSPSTMAPEQFDDPDGVDFRADVYGLGCVFYMALTGKRPFPGSPIGKVLEAKRAPLGPDPRELVPHVTEDAALLARGMMACDRDARPKSYEEIIRRCRAMISADPSISTPSTWLVPTDEENRRTETADPRSPGGGTRPRRWLLAAAALVASSVSAWMFLPEGAPPAPNRPPAVRVEPVTLRVGVPTKLVARASDEDDGDVITVRWRQTAGPDVGLQDAGDGTAACTPTAEAQGKELAFTATATDGEGGRDEATVRAPVSANAPPTLTGGAWRIAEDGTEVPLEPDAGSPPTVAVGDRIVLAAAVEDDGLSDLQAQWTQVAGCRLPLAGGGRVELAIDHAIPTYSYLEGPHLIFRAAADDGYNPAAGATAVARVEPTGQRLFAFRDDDILRGWQPDGVTAWRRYDVDVVAVRPQEEDTVSVLESPLPEAFCLSGAIQFVMADQPPEAAGLRLELEDGGAPVLWLETVDASGASDGPMLAGAFGSAGASDPWPPSAGRVVRRLRLDGSSPSGCDWMAFHLSVEGDDVRAAWGRGDSGEGWVDREELTLSSRPERLALFVRKGHARFHDFRLRSLR